MLEHNYEETEDSGHYSEVILNMARKEDHYSINQLPADPHANEMNIICSEVKLLSDQHEASISQGETDISQELIIEDYQTEQQQAHTVEVPQ